MNDSHLAKRLLYRCETKKVRYRDKREALNALEALRIRREQGLSRRQERRYYRCPLCKGWHLTSARNAHQRAAQRAANLQAMHTVADSIFTTSTTSERMNP